MKRIRIGDVIFDANRIVSVERSVNSYDDNTILILQVEVFLTENVSYSFFGEAAEYLWTLLCEDATCVAVRTLSITEILDAERTQNDSEVKQAVVVGTAF